LGGIEHIHHYQHDFALFSYIQVKIEGENMPATIH